MSKEKRMTIEELHEESRKFMEFCREEDEKTACLEEELKRQGCACNDVGDVLL